MIKLGCMSLSYNRAFSEGRMDLPAFIDKAYELGLDGIDLHTGAFASEEEDYLRDIRMRCLKRGLAISYIGISNNFGKPLTDLPDEIDKVKHWIDVAEQMRVPMVRIFGAWEREDEPKEVIWSRMIDCIKAVMAYAGEKGIVVGLHNHNHGCVTRTGDDVIRILDEVDHPYFSHIMDTGQYAGSPGASGAEGKPDPNYDFYGSMEKSVPFAVHVRAKIYRIQTGEEVWLDYPRILKIIRGANFNGWMSIVYEGQAAEPEETAVPKAVSYLRGLLND